jgi:hypothetical protein
MLKFSRTQIEIMGSATEPQFHRKLLGQLRTEYPEQTRGWTDAALLEEIRVVHERAKAYGLLSAPTVCQFIYLYIALGSKFYDDPYIDGYLKKEPTRAEERFSMLLDVIIKQLQMTASKKE